jgi:hypothetical protein
MLISSTGLNVQLRSLGRVAFQLLTDGLKGVPELGLLGPDGMPCRLAVAITEGLVEAQREQPDFELICLRLNYNLLEAQLDCC